MKTVLGMVAALAPLLTFAANLYWVGPESGGKLSVLDNWRKENGDAATTLASNTAVFTNEAPLSIIDDRHYGSENFNSIRVEKGNVYFCKNGGSRSYTYLNNSPTFYVAEGALFSCTNDFAAYHGGSKFTKTGKGVFELHGSLDSPGTFNPTTVSEGTLRLVADSDADQALRSQKVVVKDGATLEVCTKGGKVYSIYDNKGGHAPLQLEEGSTLRLLGGTCKLTGVTGAGDIEAPGEDVSYLVFRDEPNELPEFTGTLTGNFFIGSAVGSTNRFLVKSADYLKDIRGLCAPDGIVFAAGVTNFNIHAIDGAQGGTLKMEDADGVTLSFRTAILNGSGLSFSGAGDLTITNTATLAGSKFASTGVLSVEGPYTLTLGDGTTAGDFDYAAGTPSAIRFSADSTLQFKNYGAADVSIPVVGDGKILFLSTSSAYVTLRNLHKNSTPGRPSFDAAQRAPWELAGGEAGLPNELTGSGGAARSQRITGGRWYQKKHATTSSDPNRTVKTPSHVTVYGSSGWYSIAQTGGEFYSNGGSGLKNLYLRGGKTYFTPSCLLCTSDGTQKDGGRSQMVFDSGSLFLPRPNGSDSITIFTSNDNTNRTVVYVSDRGGRFVVQDEAPGNYTSFYDYVPVEVCTNTVTSGLWDLSFNGKFEFKVPFALNGPVRVSDAEFIVGTKNTDATTGSAVGTGLLKLRNATYRTSFTATGVETAIPGGLEFEGGSLVSLSTDKGEKLAVKSISRTGPGSMLMVYASSTAAFGTTDGTMFTVTDGLENDAETGALKLPIFMGSGDAHRYAEFAKYDIEKGVVPFDNYVTSLSEADATKIVKLFAGDSVPANTVRSVGGLCFAKSSFLDVSVAGGATLKIGNGTDPAAFLMNICGCLTGGGTVDFGGSEGLFYVPTSHQGNPNQISVTLAGSNGVSYFCVNRAHDQKVSVNNANTYTGGTRVWGVDLYANNALAFAEGDVYVGGGWARGGRIILNKEGATFANAFHLAGRGNSHTTETTNKGDLYLNAYRKGALSFAKNATVSGLVELVEETRVTAADEVRGTISGVVSGDRLQVYKTFADADAGVVALTGANTYTGGTEVVGATLELAQGTGAGTGKVMLDNATLQFANATPVTFANAIEGAGKVRLCGAGVDFTGDVSDLTAPTLELTGGAYDFTVTPPFATVTNTLGKAKMTLKAPGAYDLSGLALNGKILLALEKGATLDLKGGTLDVYQFRGDRNDVNGTINNQIPDYPGLLIYVK